MTVGEALASIDIARCPDYQNETDWGRFRRTPNTSRTNDNRSAQHIAAVCESQSAEGIDSVIAGY